ncbi:transposase [Streptomyces sp. NPDC057963]|uniref:transposase n=1 Tax=Streptomyces sp. NPDC057963 TaxID=3346290 RepID=UPI0036EEC42C
MGRDGPSDAGWERVRPFLPVGNRRGGRRRDHRRVIDAGPHRVRTGVRWHGLREHRGDTAWRSLRARRVEGVREVRARGRSRAGPPAGSTEQGRPLPPVSAGIRDAGGSCFEPARTAHWMGRDPTRSDSARPTGGHGPQQ